MGLAMLYPEAGGKSGRGKKAAANPADSGGFSERRLKEAPQVLAYSRPMVEEVIKGNRSLDEALKAVKEDQQRAEGIEAKRERLRKGAPDLFMLVKEERSRCPTRLPGGMPPSALPIPSSSIMISQIAACII